MEGKHHTIIVCAAMALVAVCSFKQCTADVIHLVELICMGVFGNAMPRIGGHKRDEGNAK